MSESPRDIFLTQLLDFAKKDQSILLLSVDMGAPALDLWRRDLPQQVLDMGIAEQNAINVAAGLSKGGKKVFVYFMAAWVHRCFEQIRYSCGMAQNKVTILGNGVGMGYAPAGPAHQPNEDLAVMRSLHNMSIWTASEGQNVENLVSLCLNSSSSNYVRLERKSINVELPETTRVENFEWGQKTYFGLEDPEYIFVSYGYMASRLKQMMIKNTALREKVALLDLMRLWPLSVNLLQDQFESIRGVLFVEEQSKSGSISEAMISSSDLIRNKKIGAIHLPDFYIFDNLDQEAILNKYGFDEKNICNAIFSL